jgi:voltage-gated sodium channel
MIRAAFPFRESELMIEACRRIAASSRFQNTVMAVIAANAVLIGVETDAGLMARYGSQLHVLNVVFQVLFVIELVIRLTAHAPRVWTFFRDGWNVFDFLVVSLSLLPAAGAVASVARLARLLRALRLVSAMPELRLIVTTMLRSIPSLANVIALLGIILYVYAVLGVNLFAKVDPENWGNLAVATLTLFEILTLEGWVDLQNTGFTATSWAWLYFVSYVVLAVFVVVNLFIAIVINNLEAAKNEQRNEADAAGGNAPALARLAEIRQALDAVENELRAKP